MSKNSNSNIKMGVGAFIKACASIRENTVMILIYKNKNRKDMCYFLAKLERKKYFFLSISNKIHKTN